MIISHNLKYVFVSVPKAGTHTMYHVLEKEYDGLRQDGAYHQRDIPEECNEYFSFSTTRHPLDRAVSIWRALTEVEWYSKIYLPRIGGDSFLSFVRWVTDLTDENRPTGRGAILLTPQWDWIGKTKIEKFIPLENITDEFQQLPFVNRPQSIPKLLAREGKPWEEVGCAKSLELLLDWAKDDFQNFGYSVKPFGR